MNKLWIVTKNELIRYFISPLAYVYLVAFLLLNGSFAKPLCCRCFHTSHGCICCFCPEYPCDYGLKNSEPKPSFRL